MRNLEFEKKCLQALARAIKQEYNVEEAWIQDPRNFYNYMKSQPGADRALEEGFIIKRTNQSRPFDSRYVGWAKSLREPVIRESKTS